jgi:hypothetical protein
MAVFTSNSVIDLLPLMLTRRPLAPSIVRFSRSGDWIAILAALRARPSPWDSPMPIRASPAPAMMLRTSAKSTLMSPWRVMTSVMACTAWRSTLSAVRNASREVVDSSMISKRRSLGIASMVSTCGRSSSMPWSPWFLRTWPSKSKGRVTTATTRGLGSNSRAIWATTGAEPVPVPPPMPAVMKTMSAPVKTSRMRSRLSSVAWRPKIGLPPTPRPLVMRSPNCSRTGARFRRRAWLSVLAAMNSTWERPLSIMRLTALPPAPPRPMTLMSAGCSLKSSLNLICTILKEVLHETAQFLAQPDAPHGPSAAGPIAQVPVGDDAQGGGVSRGWPESSGAPVKF